MFHLFQSALALVAALAMATGCATDLSEPERRPQSLDAGGEDWSRFDTDELTTILLNPMVQSSEFMSVVASGRGPAGGRLMVNSDAGGTLSFPIDSGGNFCVDLQLSPERLNNFTFVAQNVRGEILDVEIARSVQQVGGPPASTGVDPEVSALENIARNAPNFYTPMRFEEGQSSMIFDGNDSIAVLEDSGWHRQYLNFDLAAAGDVRSIEIESTSDCNIGDAIVYYSDEVSTEGLVYFNPFDGLTEWAEHTSGEWKVWGEIHSQGGADASHNLLSPQRGSSLVRRVALEFLSDDCDGFAFRGRHKIKELRVMARSSSAPAESSHQGPTCQNGGR